jgi:nitrite reductase/ring-hydroxylating ferredoxin subunit
MKIELIALSRCRPDGGTFVECRGRELAIFRYADSESVVVIDNACPHAGGNLAAGSLEGHIVTCPWHQWQFDLRTGVCMHSALARVRRYPAVIRDGTVWIELT